jgi:hypothetical protein
VLASLGIVGNMDLQKEDVQFLKPLEKKQNKRKTYIKEKTAISFRNTLLNHDHSLQATKG